MRLYRAHLLGIALLGANACIDAARINSTCTWTDTTGALDLRRQSDREHLRQDAQIAWELAVRFGDTRYRHTPASALPLRRQCRQEMENTIIERHNVTGYQVSMAARSRTWWVDVVLVFIPMIVLTIVARDLIVRRIRGPLNSQPHVVTMISLALLVATGALITAGVTQFYAMGIETIRLRNGHVADRGSVLPSGAHPGLTYLAAFLVCLIVTIVRLRRPHGAREVPAIAP